MPGPSAPAFSVVLYWGMTSAPDMQIIDRVRSMAVGEHLQDRVRYGLDTVGWEGDPWVTLCYNKLEDRYEVWYTKDETKPVCLMRSAPRSVQPLPSICELCIHLRDHDLNKWSAAQIEKRVDDHNASVVKAIQDKNRDAQAEALEKVYWNVGHAVGEYKPVISMNP